MRTSGRAHEREQLERDLGTETGLLLLRRLHQAVPEAARFSTWPELAEFMVAGRPDDPRRDAILRGLIECRRNGSLLSVWNAAMLLLFWPALLRLFKGRRDWDPDEAELWSTIREAFLDSVHGLDLAKRPDRLATKIMGDTRWRSCRAYGRRWRSERRRSPDAYVEDVVGDDDLNFAAMDLRGWQREELARYRLAYERGVISEEDLLLLVATCVYGQSVADYVREHEGTYDSWKKRRQRALEAVQVWETSG
jgi:hypothetical protein